MASNNETLQRVAKINNPAPTAQDIRQAMVVYSD